MPPRKRLGGYLLEAGAVSPDQLAFAVESQRATGQRLGAELVSLGYATDEQVLSCLSEQLRVPGVDLARAEATAQALRAVPLDVMVRYQVFPLEVARGRVVLAMADPTDVETLRELEFLLGVGVRAVVACAAALAAAIAREQGRALVSEDRVASAGLLPDPKLLLERLLAVVDEKGSVDRHDVTQVLRGVHCALDLPSLRSVLVASAKRENQSTLMHAGHA